MEKNKTSNNKEERLSARIAARKAIKKPSPYAENRSMFLALKDEIKDSLGDGHNVLDIWETLHEEGKIKFSYESFRKYVNRMILSSPPESVATTKNISTPDQEKSTADKTQNQPKSIGFTFNSTPNKEDLF